MIYNNFKPGSLMRLEETFYLPSAEVYLAPVIDDNNINWDKQILIKPKSLLLFVKPLDYFEETTIAVPCHGATTPGPTEWGKAKMKVKTKKFPGGIFLIPNGQLIWVSHYNLKYFEIL